MGVRNPGRDKAQQRRGGIGGNHGAAFFDALKRAAGNAFLGAGQQVMAELMLLVRRTGSLDEFCIFDPLRTDRRNEDALWGQFSGQGPAVAQEKGLGRRIDGQFRNRQESGTRTNLDEVAAGLAVWQD